VEALGDAFTSSVVDAPDRLRIYSDAARSRPFTDGDGARFDDGTRLRVVVLATSGDGRLVLLRQTEGNPRPAVGWVRASDLGL